MKQGKRYIRNTVLVLFGVTVLGVAASRIYAAVVQPDTAPWVRRLLSLGLQVQEGREPAMQVVDIADAARLRFTQLSVEGGFAVEVVAAPVHRVSLTHPKGETWTVSAQGGADGLLRLTGDADVTEGVLRIEAPALTGIEARDLQRLTIRGWRIPELSLRMKDVGGVGLEESAVGRWTIHSDSPVVIDADAATTAAGLEILASGDFSLRGAGGQKIDFQGKDGRFSMRSSK